jgi:hypothetical protein
VETYHECERIVFVDTKVSIAPGNCKVKPLLNLTKRQFITEKGSQKPKHRLTGVFLAQRTVIIKKIVR